MYRPRVIPVLLLQENILYKSIQFKDHKYIGDPINAVKLFNDLKADELTFLDIEATRKGQEVSIELIRDIGEEANMPFTVGGGVRSIDQIQQIIGAGAEKVIIGSYAIERPEFIKEATDAFGSSTICVCIDVKKKFLGKERVWTVNGTKQSNYAPVDFAKKMEEMGAGEIVVQSIDHDGMMEGYNIPLLERVSAAVTIPVVALGGASNLSDVKEAYQKANVNGLAAGSMFIYHGKKRGVLINYPNRAEILETLKK